MGPKKKQAKAKPKAAPAASAVAGASAGTASAGASPAATSNTESSFFGSDYPYYSYIKTPSAMGMSSKGDMKTLAKDVTGIQEYIDLLFSGKSTASKTGKPLGNKYFLNTGGTCIAKDTNKEVDRYIYINNVPTGNIPLLSSVTGNLSDSKGLFPGILTNLNVLNPSDLMNAFSTSTTPSCMPIKLQTISNKNVVGSGTNYIATMDIEDMDPCLFPNKINPVTKAKCKEGFLPNMQKSIASDAESIMLPDDPIVQLYYAGLSALGIYILYRIIEKSK
jgi:hypothetical protein